MKTKRICNNGHTYFKSSDCPTCPDCAGLEKPSEGMLSLLAAPARRALIRANITSEVELSKYSKNEILSMHGIGPSCIPKLEKALQEKGLKFKKSV
ncbi:MAG: hypothetical protein IPP69_17315 [Flavobacteriales bacterium]|nr:hypothetical protein [Flavobacteriales bacterium]